VRTKTQDKRLLKLIKFLEELPPDKFDFSQEVADSKSNGKTCATVACAIGWTPKIFPRLVEWTWYDTGYFTGFKPASGHEKCIDYMEVAEQLFGVPKRFDIFYPGNPMCYLPQCGTDAAPKQVAKMLRTYRKIYP
jgi:hypothetical protein